MKRTFIIFRKELKDVLRDRRTLMMMVVLPMVLVPVLITVVTKVQQAQIEKAEAKELHIAFVGKEYAPELYALARSAEKIVLIDNVPVDSIPGMTAREELDGAIIVDPEFLDRIARDQQGQVQIVYKASDAFETALNRLTEIVEQYNDQIVAERIARLNLDKDLFEAVAVEKVDVSSVQERIAELAGGFLPYLFIIFGFMGAMYPGLDLGAGEKERGTLETLLSTPASRLEIVLGKFGVVTLAGVATALIAMSGLYIAAHRFPEIPTEVFDVIMDMLGPKMVLLLMTLILPISAFFAAAILGVSIYARSFKEAQSIVAPINIAIIFPALIGTLPGIELNPVTALIPILNVSLATKKLLAGTINPYLLTEVYLSLFFLAGISIWGCVKWFNREETLFRS
jgi:sodium transport system permease protein